MKKIETLEKNLLEFLQLTKEPQTNIIFGSGVKNGNAETSYLPGGELY
jgi:hypothetical protein